MKGDRGIERGKTIHTTLFDPHAQPSPVKPDHGPHVTYLSLQRSPFSTRAFLCAPCGAVDNGPHHDIEPVPRPLRVKHGEPLEPMPRRLRTRGWFFRCFFLPRLLLCNNRAPDPEGWWVLHEAEGWRCGVHMAQRLARFAHDEPHITCAARPQVSCGPCSSRQ